MKSATRFCSKQYRDERIKNLEHVPNEALKNDPSHFMEIGTHI